jgi:hypothetical protein
VKFLLKCVYFESSIDSQFIIVREREREISKEEKKDRKKRGAERRGFGSTQIHVSGFNWKTVKAVPMVL